MNLSEGKEIQILDKDTINKIAAGEVIERPASVVKELVDNSIDAGAHNIRIELEDSGKRLIVVKDDGKGMSREDVVLCPVKHATSKIRNADDLESVRTMGFRGEALASISSVSQFEIVTKRRDDPVGSHLVTEEGKAPKIFDVGTADGTAVYVRDLFCSVPVRKKYLKSDATELAHIVRIVGELILANESLSITLINNGRKIISSPGSTLKNAVSDVLGPEISRLMIPVAGDDAGETGRADGADSPEKDAVRISGFISKPEFNRATPEFMIFIVNGRPVSSKELMKAVRLGYYTKIPNTRYPAAVIRIDLPPELIDVNVHPRKTEVRFADEKTIQRLLTERIEESLRQADLATTLTAEKTGKIIARPLSLFGNGKGEEAGKENGKNEETERENGKSEETKRENGKSEETERENGKNEETERENGKSEETKRESGKSEETKRENGKNEETKRDNGKSEETEEDERRSGENLTVPGFPETERPTRKDPSEISGYSGKTSSVYPAGRRDLPVQRDGRERYEGRYAAPVVDTDRRLIRSSRMLDGREEKTVGGIEDIRIVGQISDLYILAETGNNDLVIIDQHAAHERIFYDLFRSMNRKQTQELIDPVVLHLSPKEKVLIREYIPILEETGFGVSEFGENDFIVSFVPLVFGKLCGADVIRDLVTDIFETGKPKSAEDAEDLILKRMACRAAIKSGAGCTEEQMKELIRQLRKTDHPYSCPHGRPVIVTLSLKEIGKLFERL